ncbi:MAG: AbrB family transcriptional regulator [Thermocladium sp. ECH_B]|nr:MAG: AbrB family transcriptional regulator [Thermocladium sp. ECH_B]
MLNRGSRLVRRGAPGFKVDGLPYGARVYMNNQVLMPASLVRLLNVIHVRYVDLVVEHKGIKIEMHGVKLLKTRHTDSRQFTIPKDIRDKYGIQPGDKITIIEVRRSSAQ